MLHISKQHPQEHLPEFIETLIIFTILLVVGHTIIEEMTAIYRFDHIWTIWLSYTAFLFDLVFTAEFIARSVITGRRGHFKKYFLLERGWIDLITSVPLLLFVSGPTILVLLLGREDQGEALQFLVILKTAKAIRVTRVLRLLRVMKIFGRIQNTNSKMTNRHVGTIATISVVTLVIVLVVSQFVSFLRFGDHYELLRERTSQIAPLFAGDTVDNNRISAYVGRAFPDIIEIRDPKGTPVFENPQKARLRWTAFHERNVALPGGYTFWMSYHEAEAEHAKLNLLVLVTILAIIISFMFFYSGIFAHQVADPVFIMDRGFREWDYNLEVKVHPGYQDEEIFRLAAIYNSSWLPLKNQIHNYRRAKGDEKSVLSVDDLLNP